MLPTTIEPLEQRIFLSAVGHAHLAAPSAADEQAVFSALNQQHADSRALAVQLVSDKGRKATTDRLELRIITDDLRQLRRDKQSIQASTDLSRLNSDKAQHRLDDARLAAIIKADITKQRIVFSADKAAVSSAKQALSLHRAGKSSFVVFSNAQDSRIFSATTADQTTITASGTKTRSGTAVGEADVTNSQKQQTKILFDANHKPVEIEAYNGVFFGLNWASAGTIVVTATDGQLSANANVALSAASPQSIALKKPSVPDRSPVALSSRIRPSALTEGNDATLQINVTECGTPVDDALVGVNLTPDVGPQEVLEASHVGLGLYAVTIPTAVTPTPSQSEINDVIEKVAAAANMVCPALESVDSTGSGPAIAAAITVAALKAGAALGLSTPFSAAVAAAINTAIAAMNVYCSTLDASPAPGAPSTGEFIAKTLVGILNTATADPTGRDTVSAFAADPGEDTVSSGSETVSAAGPFPSLSIDVGRVDHIEVNPPTAQVAAGQALQLVGRPIAPSGKVLTYGGGRHLIWGSTDPSVATVDPTTGVVTAVAAGTATIQAVDTIAAQSGSATITVIDVVDHVEISPVTATVESGSTVALSAKVVGKSGNPIDVPIAWTSSDASVATVDSTGLVRALANGLAQITATEPGSAKSATSRVTVGGTSLATWTIGVEAGTGAVNPGIAGTYTATSIGLPIGRSDLWHYGFSASSIDASGYTQFLSVQVQQLEVGTFQLGPVVGPGQSPAFADVLTHEGGYGPSSDAGTLVISKLEGREYVGSFFATSYDGTVTITGSFDVILPQE